MFMNKITGLIKERFSLNPASNSEHDTDFIIQQIGYMPGMGRETHIFSTAQPLGDAHRDKIIQRFPKAKITFIENHIKVKL